jgi:hypothetical protein
MAAIADLRLPEDSTPNADKNPGALNSALQELKQLLTENEFIPPKLIRAIKTNAPADIEDQYHLLYEHISNIRYTDALVLLKQIMEYRQSRG